MLSCVHSDEDDNTPHFAPSRYVSRVLRQLRANLGWFDRRRRSSRVHARASVPKSDESVLLLPQAGDVDVDANENLTSEFNSALEEGALSSLASPSSKDQSRPLALVTTSKSTTTKVTMTNKEQSHRVTSALVESSSAPTFCNEPKPPAPHCRISLGRADLLTLHRRSLKSENIETAHVRTPPQVRIVRGE